MTSNQFTADAPFSRLEVDQRGEGEIEAGVGDLRGLQVANVTRAVELGIAAGQAAIADVLTGGLVGVLGPKHVRGEER